MTAGHIFASDDFLGDESELYVSMDEDSDEDEFLLRDDEKVVELDLESLDDVNLFQARTRRSRRVQSSKMMICLCSLGLKWDGFRMCQLIPSAMG